MNSTFYLIRRYDVLFVYYTINVDYLASYWYNNYTDMFGGKIIEIGFFTNDRYKILSCMASYQRHVNGMKIVPLSQQQIADEVGLSKKKVNSIIAELKLAGYVSQQSPTRGKYVLPQSAENLLATMEEIGV